MSHLGLGNALASGGLSTSSRPSAPSQRPVPKQKGFCEIAISPFDPSQLVHASDADKRARPHDVVRLPAPSHTPDQGWMRQSTNVRLSSGCAVIVEHELTSNVDLVHMLQWRPCGDARTDLILTQFVSESLECTPASMQRHTIISSPHPLASCAFIPASSSTNPLLIIVTTAALYEVSLQKESAEAGTFHSVAISRPFPLELRTAVDSAGQPLSPAVASDIADCVPMLSVSGSEWHLSFIQDNGRVYLFDKNSNGIISCAPPAPPPSPPPASTWMGSLIAVLPFQRQAPVATPQPTVATAQVLDAVNPRHWMTVCAMSDCTFTCTAYNGSEQVESILVPRPEEADPHYGVTPDGVPDSACITCTTDGGALCVAAAWVMPLHKAHVRSIFVFQSDEQETLGKLVSEEVFTENPKSSLHAVSSLAIQCNKVSNRLCLVGSRPPAPSHSSQVDFSRKHVTAIEIIRMRQIGKPSGSPTSKVVHSLSSQMRDDINSLQMELGQAVHQRAKAVPRSGELHSVGSSDSLSSIFVQFLRQSQWWQHFPSRLSKLLPSNKPFGDDWALQSAQAMLRPQTRSTNHQSKKLRVMGSDADDDNCAQMHSKIMNYIEQVFDESMCTPTRSTKLMGRVFPCDDLPYACVAIDSAQSLFQPLLSGSFFIVKSAYVCAVVDTTQNIRDMVPPSVNLHERIESRKEHSRFFLYPSDMFVYSEDFFDDLLKMPTLPASGSLHEIMAVQMSCFGFKAFVLDSLLGYFYSTRHNFIRLLRATEDGSAVTDSDKSTLKLVRQNERFYGCLRQLSSVVVCTDSRQCSALSVLNAAWLACLRSSSPSEKTLLRLVTLACFKLLSPFLASLSSGSSVDSIPLETVRACQLFIKLVDFKNDATVEAPPSLLTLVRFVLAVRNVDGVSAQKFACSLLLPPGAAIDPFRCYHEVRLVLLASNMTSELCDVLSALLLHCKSNSLNVSKDQFEHVFTAYLDCARLTRPGGALQLLLDHPSFSSNEHFEKIIHRAIILRRFDVLKDGLAAQHALDFFKNSLIDKWQFWTDFGPHGEQNREALVRAALVHCLDPSRKDQHEGRYVAAACSLRMAKAKFESKKWSSALQHADAALNSIKLLREKVGWGGIQTQEYALLPALSPESGALPTNWMDDVVHCNWPQRGVTRCAVVLGRERLSEADLRLFCAVLRTLTFLESDEASQGFLDSMLSGATLSGLHVFALSFYKRLINYDGRESAGILSNAPRWLSGTPGFIQVLESAFDIMVAYYQLPHGQSICPPADAVSRLSNSLCDPRDAAPEKLPEHFVRICVQCIHSALRDDTTMAAKFDCFAWLSQTIARLERTLECTPPLLLPESGTGARTKHSRSLGFFHQVAIAQMAAIGIVPPYDFISDGMGVKNAGSELCYENNNVGIMALAILKVSPEMAELILARFLEWVVKRMGVAPGRRYDDVVAPSSVAASGSEGKSASKTSVKVGMGSLLLVPAGSFEVLGLVKGKRGVHVPESIIELTPPKMKLEENYKLYKLVAYMASLLCRKWISASDETLFRGSCSDQIGINVAASPYAAADNAQHNYLNEIISVLRQAVPK